MKSTNYTITKALPPSEESRTQLEAQANKLAADSSAEIDVVKTKETQRFFLGEKDCEASLVERQNIEATFRIGQIDRTSERLTEPLGGAGGSLAVSRSDRQRNQSGVRNSNINLHSPAPNVISKRKPALECGPRPTNGRLETHITIGQKNERL